MRHYLLLVCLLFSSFILPNSAVALSVELQNKIKSYVHKQVPNIVIDEITDTVVPGLYQATAGAMVFYTNADGRYLVYGELLDISRKKENWSLTEETRKAVRRSLLQQVPISAQIIYKPKTTKAIVTVFTDVDCSYCRKLHAEVDELIQLGIEVRYMAFPRSGIGTASYDKAVSIWCAADRNTALTKVKQGEKIVTAKDCKTNLVAEQFKLGIKLGVSGTPALIFADGTLLPGYLPAKKLAKEAQNHADPHN